MIEAFDQPPLPLGIERTVILDRQFLFQGFASRVPRGGDETQYWGVEIKGDGLELVFSFTGQFGGSGVAIAGDTILVNGHCLRVTVVPGEYIVDEVPLCLSRGWTHYFMNGRFAFTAHCD